jgi:AraC family transcriptional regulator of arabinose operon
MSASTLANQERSTRGFGLLTHPRLVSPPTYWRCEPSWSWVARPLPDHLIWYVLDGVGELRLGGERYPLEAGACVVFRPGDEPSARHDPRRRLLVFGMHFDAGPDAVPPVRWCRLRDQALAAALARRCERAHRRGDPLGRRHAALCLAELLCLAWEDATVPAPAPGDAALEEITTAIRQDPSRRWNVAELAARAALSRAQFTRRFTAHAGLPPAAYQIRARIERARQLLTETALPVADVAATLGYPDVSAFSRQYRRVTGHPPGHARRRG